MQQAILLSEEESFFPLPSFLGIYFYACTSEVAVHLAVAVVVCYQNGVPVHLVICKLLHSGGGERLPNSEHVNGPTWSRCCWWATSLQQNSLHTVVVPQGKRLVPTPGIISSLPERITRLFGCETKHNLGTEASVHLSKKKFAAEFTFYWWVSTVLN